MKVFEVASLTDVVPFTKFTSSLNCFHGFFRNVSGSDSGISSGISTPVKRRARYFYEDDEGREVQPQPRKRKSCPTRWAKNPNVDVAAPEDITDEMLDNVADYVSEKVSSLPPFFLNSDSKTIYKHRRLRVHKEG